MLPQSDFCGRGAGFSKYILGIKMLLLKNEAALARRHDTRASGSRRGGQPPGGRHRLRSNSSIVGRVLNARALVESCHIVCVEIVGGRYIIGSAAGGRPVGRVRAESSAPRRQSPTRRFPLSPLLPLSLLPLLSPTHVRLGSDSNSATIVAGPQITAPRTPSRTRTLAGGGAACEPLRGCPTHTSDRRAHSP